jgi:hypothetical protein
LSTNTLAGPDVGEGVALSQVTDNAMLLGHAHGEPVILMRRNQQLFAIGAVCTHYGRRSIACLYEAVRASAAVIEFDEEATLLWTKPRRTGSNDTSAVPQPGLRLANFTGAIT